MHGKWRAAAPTAGRPTAATVDVWLIEDDLFAADYDVLVRLLDRAERERAARFREHRDWRTYVLAHSVLRCLLARRVAASPATIRFGRGRYGKPFLLRDAGAAGVRFNLSHTMGWIAIAMALDVEVGIDVEAIDPLSSSLQLADQFFCTDELQSLYALPASARLQGFFNCWTRKEAFIKATGEGLHRPLDSFAVSLQPGTPAALLACDGRVDMAAQWSIVDLPVSTCTAGAVAVAAPVVDITVHRAVGRCLLGSGNASNLAMS